MSQDYRGQVDSWLQDLKRTLGIFDHLQLDDQGVCFVPHPRGLEIDVELPNGASTVYIYTGLLTVEAHSKEEVFQNALALNMFQIQTNGGSLAFDAATGDIMYCCRFEAPDYDSQKFLRCFYDFVAVAEDLASKVKGHTSSAAPVQSGGQAPAQLEEMIPRGFSIKI